MRNSLVGGVLAVVTAMMLPTASAADDMSYVITNPCERGPVPEWSLINSSRPKFVAFLQRVRPNMPLDVAENIAYMVCDDLTLLKDNVALTRRTNLLIRQAGY